MNKNLLAVIGIILAVVAIGITVLRPAKVIEKIEVVKEPVVGAVPVADITAPFFRINDLLTDWEGTRFVLDATDATTSVVCGISPPTGTSSIVGAWARLENTVTTSSNGPNTLSFTGYPDRGRNTRNGSGTVFANGGVVNLISELTATNTGFFLDNNAVASSTPVKLYINNMGVGNGQQRATGTCGVIFAQP